MNPQVHVVASLKRAKTPITQKKSFTFRQSGKSPSRATRTLNYNYTTNNKTMNANIHISWLQHKILLLSTAMYRFSYICSLQLAAECAGLQPIHFGILTSALTEARIERSTMKSRFTVSSALSYPHKGWSQSHRKMPHNMLVIFFSCG